MVDSPLIGKWMASQYGIQGQRVDLELEILNEGKFVWRAFGQNGWRAEWSGQWSHEDAAGVLRLSSAEPRPEFFAELWSVLELAGLGSSNSYIVLLRVELISRNLPVLFYRVRPSA